MSCNMEIILYKPEHALQMLTYDRDNYTVKANEFTQWAQINADTGYSYTLLNGGRIFLCAGVKDAWNIENCKVGEAWALFSKESYEFNLTLVRILKRGLTEIINDNTYNRIQARARADSITAQRLLLVLGFEFEGILRKFEIDGGDAHMYSIIRE